MTYQFYLVATKQGDYRSIHVQRDFAGACEHIAWCADHGWRISHAEVLRWGDDE